MRPTPSQFTPRVRQNWRPISVWNTCKIAATSHVDVPATTVYTVPIAWILRIKRIVFFSQDITTGVVMKQADAIGYVAWDSAQAGFDSMGSSLTPRILFDGKSPFPDSTFVIRIFVPSLNNEIPIEGYELDQGQTVGYNISNGFGGTNPITDLNIVFHMSGIEYTKGAGYVGESD